MVLSRTAGRSTRAKPAELEAHESCPSLTSQRLSNGRPHPVLIQGGVLTVISSAGITFVSPDLPTTQTKENTMIKLRNKQLAAFAAIAGLGIGAVAAPAVALAASHPASAKVVKTDPTSADKAGTKDGTSRDTKVDKTSGVDKSSVDKASVDRKTDR
jgi:hypothetical protein